MSLAIYLEIGEAEHSFLYLSFVDLEDDVFKRDSGNIMHKLSKFFRSKGPFGLNQH